MGLIGDHGKAFALGCRKLAYGRQGKGEGLDRADHDLLIAGEGLCQLAALAAIRAGDAGHHAWSALEVDKGFLQLVVDHIAVRHHQHRVIHLAVFGVVQLGQEVGSPGDRLGLAGAGGVLDQVLATRPFSQHGGLELAGDIKLVVAGEDHRLDLLFLVAAGDQIAAQNLQPAVALPHLLPEVAGAVAALGIQGIAGAAVVAPVEGQKSGGRAKQLGGHAHLAGAHGEVNQGPIGKRQQRFGPLALGDGVAIKAVLVHRVTDRLGEVGFEFGGGHGQAIEEQHQIDAVLVVDRIAQLTHHPQPVERVAGQDVGVKGQGRLELGQL